MFQRRERQNGRCLEEVRKKAVRNREIEEREKALISKIEYSPNSTHVGQNGQEMKRRGDIL